ncbi:CaiB/BaiF CoA transferase family protein [Peristeroidobacter soli]|uniref:CaiB/BaiF CoA transferase family protein n=1 Tax=Peristeroidobacter soli TaxID=2497877 RepID=UPI00101D2C82|nr:CoA transferase [Peristeroidobacter soli]
MNEQNTGALHGIKVLDLSRVLGGPYCTQILGDHGADVIKVEPPDGDETRTWGPPFNEGSAAYFEGANRNKRSIALNLNSPAGQRVVFELLEQSDVLVQNFKLSSLRRWGLHPTLLQKQFPRLVHCWITGFGEDGPLGGLPGYDAVAQGLTGLMSVNGERDGAPLRLGIPIIDLVTGINAALGIMLALRDRDISGKGQVIESSLFDNGLSLLHPFIANFLRSGQIAKPAGSAHPNITPYDRFITKNGSIFLAVGNNGQFESLCQAIGAAELAADSRFASNERRTQNRDAMKALIETKLACLDVHEICERLNKAGVPCGPVQNIKEAIEHPHTVHREMIVGLDGYRGVASPIKMSRSKPTYRRRPPRVNEHQHEIVASLPTTPTIQAQREEVS